MDSTNLYKKAQDTWGKNAQLLQVVEEMSELSVELIKHVNRQKSNLVEIAEEAADVEIMLEQLKYCLGIEEDIARSKKQKLQKLNNLLNQPKDE